MRLFNAWGVGRATEDDGVLMLLVERQRRIDVVLGDGCARQYGIDNSAVQAIVSERMLPWLAKGEYGMGLVEGVSALEQLIRQNQQGKALTGQTTLLTEQQTGAPDSATASGGGGGREGGGNDGGRGTGWGGGSATTPPSSAVSPAIKRFLLIAVAGLTALRLLAPQPDAFSPASSSAPSRCSRCQGKVKLVGVVDRSNLASTSALDPSAMQSVDRPDAPPSSPSFSSFPSDFPSSSDGDASRFTLTEGNLYLPDYRVDYQHALESLSDAQAERLRRPGVQYGVYVCPDCSTLYLQESEAEQRRPLSDHSDRMYDRTPFGGVGDGGRLSGLGGPIADGAGSGNGRRPEVVWMPPAQPHVKGVRRESGMGASGGSSGGGGSFGGGSSSGGGAGANF